MMCSNNSVKTGRGHYKYLCTYVDLIQCDLTRLCCPTRSESPRMVCIVGVDLADSMHKKVGMGGGDVTRMENKRMSTGKCLGNLQQGHLGQRGVGRRMTLDESYRKGSKQIMEEEN